MDANKTVTATFTEIPTAPVTYTLTVNVTGSGSVTATPNKAAYNAGEQVSLNAVPALGWQFSGWSGDATGSANPISITMNGDKVVTATFIEVQSAPLTYTVEIVISGFGSVTIDRPGPYTAGEVITLTAIPESGWQFRGWESLLFGQAAAGLVEQNPLTVTIQGNQRGIQIMAHFVANSLYLPIVVRQ
jgi:uncharacterized repeat protein (TIGR02543 family)